MTGHRLYALTLLLAACSGCAALAHELLWTRRLVDLLGAGSASSTRVFGCFFLGLSLGAVWAARLVPRTRRPFLAVAAAEAGVALLAVPILFLPQWTAWIWPALGPERLASWPGEAIRLVLSVVTIATPSFLMGMVLPFLAVAVLRENRSLGRHGIWLYAVNTLGGVLGLLLVIGFSLETLGASRSMLAAIGLNLLVAAAALRLDRNTPDIDPALVVHEKTTRKRHLAPSRIQRLALLASFVSGFGVLALEVLALEMVTLRAPLSYQATSAVLITVISLLALASFLVPLLMRTGMRPLTLLVLALALTAAMAAWTPAIFKNHELHPAWETPTDSVAAFALQLTGPTLMTLGPMILLAGLVFPATLAWLGEAGGDRRGRQWGMLLAVNGIGGVLGAEFAYRVLLPTVGVYPGVAAVALVYLAAAIGMLLTVRAMKSAPSPWLTATAGVAVVLMLITHDAYGLLGEPEPGVLYKRSGREGTVVVLEKPRMGRAILVNNRYLLGTSSGRWDEERQTHIPLALHPAPRTVAHIGSGTGITPGAALDYPEIEQVIALELSAPVRDAARRFFAEFNHGITDSERSRVIVEDGRTYLAASRQAFDVITGDAYLPWGNGVGRLYSLEHFRGVRQALRPGGIFCQWLPMHQLTPQQVELIADTFASVFDDVHLFRNTFYLRSPGLALVGFRDGQLDWEVARDRAEQARASGIRDPVARSHEALGLLYLGRYEKSAADAPINTLGNLALELSAARERVTGPIPAKYLIGGKWMTFVRSRLASPGVFDEAPSQIRRMALLGVQASEHERVRASRSPGVRRTAAELREALPDSLRADSGADTRRWPGDHSVLR